MSAPLRRSFPYWEHTAGGSMNLTNHFLVAMPGMKESILSKLALSQTQ